MATTRLYTADDLFAMGEKSRFYLIAGELIEDVSGPISSTAAALISHYLNTHILPRKLGIVQGADGAYVLREKPDTVLIPDCSFVRAERLPPREQRTRFLRLAPDIAVEVLSPSNRRSEIDRKVAIYRDAGVRLVWLVDPFARTVIVYTPESERTLRENDTLDGGDVLPGFNLPLRDIFA